MKLRGHTYTRHPGPAIVLAALDSASRPQLSYGPFLLATQPIPSSVTVAVRHGVVDRSAARCRRTPTDNDFGVPHLCAFMLRTQGLIPTGCARGSLLTFSGPTALLPLASCLLPLALWLLASGREHTSWISPSRRSTPQSDDHAGAGMARGVTIGPPLFHVKPAQSALRRTRASTMARSAA